MALTGDVHNRLVVGNPWDPHFESMGYLLAKALPERAITSLDFATTGGTVWICTSAEVGSCGSWSQRGRPEGEGGGIAVRDRLDENGYHGVYAVGAVTASPPAKSGAPDS